MSKRFLVLTMISSVAFAAPSTKTTAPKASPVSGTPQSVLSEQVSAPAGSSAIYGKVELRPTLSNSNGRIESQNGLELGYQFTSNTRLFGAQSWNFDVRNPGNGSTLNLTFPDARVELDLNNVWTNKANGLSLDYQPRVHVPTDTLKRNNGMITFVKNQLNLTKTFNPTFSITTSLIPIIHVYSRSAGVDASGAAAANPVFENGFEVAPAFNLTSKLRFGVPFKLYSVRYANVPGAALMNARWGHTVTTKPELIYSVQSNLMLGVAYETGNLFANDLSKTTFSDALSKGVTQLVLITTL